MSFTKRHYAALAALRVSLGLLVFWWGMNRIVTPASGQGVQNKFYFGLFPGEDLQFLFGYVQVAVGLLVVVVPLQFAICAFSSATILPALLDPFALWLPFEKMSGVQHLFYPSVIIFFAGILMMMLRHEDKYNLDTLLFGPRQQSAKAPDAMPAE